MKLAFIISILVLSSCASIKSDVIPKSWLTDEITLEELHQDGFDDCLRLTKDIFPNGAPKGMKCTKETKNPFKRKIFKSSKIYRFKTPDSYTDGDTNGYRGYALVTNGIVVQRLISSFKMPNKSLKQDK